MENQNWKPTPASLFYGKFEGANGPKMTNVFLS